MSREKTFEAIESNLEVLAAIMALEYHDKNHLSGDNESRCREQRSIVEHTHRLLFHLKTTIILEESRLGK